MFLLIFAFWLILSGKITFEIIWIGLLISILVFAFAHFFFGWSWRRERNAYILLPFCIVYAAVLVWEILKANIAITPYIFGKKKPDGVIVKFDSGLSSRAANVFLANSITLTPGTITLEQNDSLFTVHCLHGEMAEEIEASVFVKLLLHMEKITKKEENK